MPRTRMDRLGRWTMVGVLSGLSLVSMKAHAAGVEDTVGGTIALGRAANYARVYDFMATWQNPANLAIAPNNAGAELRVPIFSACFDRARDNRKADAKGAPLDQDLNGVPGIQYRAQENFDEVCNEAFPLPLGNAGFTLKLSDKLGVGAGFFTPAGVGNLKFGSANNVTRAPKPNEQLPVTTKGELSPNRYLLLERNVLAGFLAVGAGFAPMPALRLGLTLASGFADITYRNFASQSPLADEEEVLNDVHVADFFVPRVTSSVASTPVDSVDLMASFTWTDDVHAKGDVEVTANGIQNAPLKNCRNRAKDPTTGEVGPAPGPHCTVSNVELDVPYQRFEVYLGARFADRLAPRSGELDPLAQERWDMEIDAYWVNTGHVKTYALTVYDQDARDEDKPYVSFSSDPNLSRPSALPARAALPHNWNDTWGARLGGDYNVIRNKLAVRAGAAYETRGVPTRNMNIDYFPLQKVTLSLGGTVRLGRIDLALSYAHTFNETVTVPVGTGAVREVVVMAPEQALAVNEGTYRSQIDTVSVQGAYRF